MRSFPCTGFIENSIIDWLDANWNLFEREFEEHVDDEDDDEDEDEADGDGDIVEVSMMFPIKWFAVSI
jgi:hypothetical protein